MPEKSTQERPVLTGLVALVAVALVLGVLAGVAGLLGTKALGLGGDSTTSSSGSGAGPTLDLPEPTITSDKPEETAGSEPSSSESPSESESEESSTDITLSAGQTSVSPMGQIDLTGTYPNGEGAILRVQLFQDGDWVDFPVTASVSNQTFTTYVQTGRTGEIKWRVVDTDNDLTSNEVTVTIG